MLTCNELTACSHTLVALPTAARSKLVHDSSRALWEDEGEATSEWQFQRRRRIVICGDLWDIGLNVMTILVCVGKAINKDPISSSPTDPTFGKVPPLWFRSAWNEAHNGRSRSSASGALSIRDLAGASGAMNVEV